MGRKIKPAGFHKPRPRCRWRRVTELAFPLNRARMMETGSHTLLMNDKCQQEKGTKKARARSTPTWPGPLYSCVAVYSLLDVALGHTRSGVALRGLPRHGSALPRGPRGLTAPSLFASHLMLHSCDV